MESSAKLTVAAVQSAPRLGDLDGNLRLMLDRLDQAAAAGARLIVFPECHLSGYCFHDAAEALQAAESVPGSSTEAITTQCQRLGVYVAFGLLEQAEERLHNTVVLVGPTGLLGRYRKTHLPQIGVDRFVDAGDHPGEVVDSAVGRLGLSICYEARFPEVHRVLALLGAELILLPTNWPLGSEIVPDAFVRVRACENRVFLVIASRVGEERGTHFIGRSQIVDPAGTVIAKAGTVGEQLVLADICPAEATNKRIGPVEEPRADLFADRRPELYGWLTDTKPPTDHPVDIVARSERCCSS